jgi:hypothetical protein
MPYFYVAALDEMTATDVRQFGETLNVRRSPVCLVALLVLELSRLLLVCAARRCKSKSTLVATRPACPAT